MASSVEICCMVKYLVCTQISSFDLAYTGAKADTASSIPSVLGFRDSSKTCSSRSVQFQLNNRLPNSNANVILFFISIYFFIKRIHLHQKQRFLLLDRLIDLFQRIGSLPLNDLYLPRDRTHHNP